MPGAMHWRGAWQTTAVPVQTPAWQLSLVVQRLPSLHVVPSGFGGFVQVPLPLSQTPGS
jgi:hypothetical protein